MKWFVLCKTCGEKIEDNTSYLGDADIPPFRGENDMVCLNSKCDSYELPVVYDGDDFKHP